MRVRSAFIAAIILSAAPLPGPATAQDQPQPATTLDCANFKKQADGSWVVNSETPFQIGSTTVSINAGTIVKPQAVILAGTDLYALLESKCRK